MNAVAAQQLISNARLRYTLSAAELERINAFLQLRAEWNRTHNLMGPKAARDPWQLDVCDALALNEVFDSRLPLYDVGSGSGVPGLILALVTPEARVILVEPLSKRAAFLKTAIHQLKINNVSVLRRRWPVDNLTSCQVVSRAVVSPDTWPALANTNSVVMTIYRYLALSRPEFTEKDFTLKKTCNYQRSECEQLCVEQWRRVQ